jgi:cytochrome c biogenesis protein CcmG/thiol:disulfide interchange protein DsbE
MEARALEAPARPARLNLKVLAAGVAVVGPLLAILILNLGRDPHAVRSPLVGRSAPGFTLIPVGGGAKVSLDGLRGTALVLNFWATWCVPCFQEQATLTAGARTWPAVKFLGVVYEDEEPKTREFLEQRGGGGYPSLMDPEAKAAIAYGVFGVPETFFIDRKGRIVEKYVGPLDEGTLALLLRKTVESAP